jgi:hypothetical protein
MKTMLFAGAALAAVAFSVPANAQPYWGYPAPYWGSPGPYWGSPGGYWGYRNYTAPYSLYGRGYYSEPDPFIRGQIRRDVPLRNRPPS